MLNFLKFFQRIWFTDLFCVFLLDPISIFLRNQVIYLKTCLFKVYSCYSFS